MDGSKRRRDKTVLFQYPMTQSMKKASRYKVKPGFRHRPTFKTKQELRDEIVDLKNEINILTYQLEASIKNQNVLKRKLEFEIASKINKKRKAEHLDESPFQKKLRLEANCKNASKINKKRKADDENKKFVDNSGKNDKYEISEESEDIDESPF